MTRATLRRIACALIRSARRGNRKAIRIVLLALLNVIRDYAHFGDHQHLISPGDNGAECPVCIDQRKASEALRELRTLLKGNVKVKKLGARPDAN